MIKFIGVYITTLILINTAAAAPTDSLASITSLKNSYQFAYNAKKQCVEVNQILSKSYISNSYQVTLPVAETYNNNVSINAVECKVDNRTPKDFKPLDSYYSVDDVFYSDARICYFQVTLPKKGSTADITFKETINDPRYLTSVYFTASRDVALSEISFKIPRWMKVELKELNFGTNDIKKTSVYDSASDVDIITYTAQNLPAMERENDSPGPTYVYPHLLVLSKSAAVSGQNFTFFGTLNDQYAWYRELTKSLQTDHLIINAKAKELTTGLSTDMDKIKAIFYYVQDNIRYIAFEDGMAGFKPEKADEVLRKKYGDCKGMANLTKALLTALGYDARLCWLGTKHIAYDYQTPSMAVDNHMICGLNYQGKTIFLDATESYLGLNEYAERIQGRQILMEDGDKYVLTRVPVATAAQNYDFEISKLGINGSALTGSVNRIWKGEDKEVILSSLNNTKKENTEEAMVKFLSDDNNTYAIRELKISSTTNPDKDLTVTYNVDDKKSLSLFSKAYYVDIDLKKELLNSAVKIAERKNDLWFPHRMHISKETELAIPSAYKISALPVNLDVVNADYEFHINYTASQGKLNYKKTILIKNTHLPKSKFEQWNKDIELLTKTYNESIILKPVTE